MKIKKRKRLWLSIVEGNLIAIVFPIMLLGYFISLNIINYFYNDTVEKNSIIVNTFTSYMDKTLDEPLEILKNIELMLKDNGGNYKNITLEKIDASHYFFQRIEIINNKGKVVYATPLTTNTIGEDRFGQDFFKYVNKNNKVYWSQPSISIVTNQPTITLALSSEDKIIVGYLNLNRIRELSGDFIKDFGNKVTVAITDEHGIFISNKNPNLANERKLEPNFDEIKDMIAKHINHATLNYNGNKIFVNISRIKLTGWYVIVYEPSNEVYLVVKNLILLLIVLLIVCLVISTILTFVRANEIVYAIKELNDQTKRIASGEYYDNIGKQSYSEFDELIDNFNLMSKEIKERDSKLKKIAYTDNLTGLPNRAFMFKELKRLVKENPNSYLGIIYFDMDNFKRINDTYGHLLGDELLYQFSKRLEKNISCDNIFIRLGGDEFILVVPDNRSKEKINLCIKKIMESVVEPFECMGKLINITVSIGIGIYPENGIRISELIQCADTAMYAAKEDGKNTYRFFDSKMKNKLQKEVNIEQALRKALLNNEFMLLFQPQVNMSKQIRGFEALVRWNSKDIGKVSPLDFIFIAEENGMIIEIGKWILKTSCEFIKIVNEKHKCDFIVSVNISPIELKDSNFFNTVTNIINSTKIKPEWLEIEITENVMIDSLEEVLIKLKQIKELKIKISLDDFGTGFSSLSYLGKLPADTLKIDKGFIKDISSNIHNQKMVESIIAMSHKLGINVVAEGIEEEAQFQILKKMDCDNIQGYYIKKPSSFKDILDFINEKNI
ncbi:EAL domain-containing protein [Clostridium sp. OS1-26]|uniref:bifunctional diguanylate cyclase/phosphodiesterase n=1 Tax=Clostridium sp. OS1-26 TaxID=3070681 RepID=UPI0027E00605|nr:EAL domain-containing protein [Clostridium sp. OS1-26]WML37449.1 EAL domain-containing protein [Clostridium sp. OS1-26]